MKKELSVVMSCYQRGHVLARTLPTLIEQGILADEIVIIDDGSTDDTARVVRKFQIVYPEVNIKYFYNNHPGWTICVHGMNCGIKLATKEIIMLTMPEMMHLNQDIKIFLDWFNDPDNDKTFLCGSRCYFVDAASYNYKTRTVFNHLTEEEFRNPIAITQRQDVYTWHEGYVSQLDTITLMPKGIEHHIAGVLKKHLITIGGYDEGFLDHIAGGYDDIDLIGRLTDFGVKKIQTDRIAGIHLPHDYPPKYARDPKMVIKNEQRLKARKPGEWKVNVGKEWGALKR